MNWWFTSVYGPQEDELKIQFLQEFKDIRALCIGPWLLPRDFNMIYQAADKNNPNLNRALIRSSLDVTSLKEIQLHSRKYTWSNERASPTLVRLDRFFAALTGKNFFLNPSYEVCQQGFQTTAPYTWSQSSNSEEKTFSL